MSKFSTAQLRFPSIEMAPRLKNTAVGGIMLCLYSRFNVTLLSKKMGNINYGRCRH